MFRPSKIMLKPGQQAPEFALQNQEDRTVRLSDFRGKNVVLFFYPKDDTPGCTVESCGFRDQYLVFRDAGAEVVGVSGDSPESHRRFAQKNQLPFQLLSDRNGRVSKAYGVPRTLGLLPGRVTFVVDGTGAVQHAFSSQFQPGRHVSEALKVLAGLAPLSAPPPREAP